MNTIVDVNDYIKLTKEERQSHINENEECIERGGDSTHHKGLLAYFLNTTIPTRGIDLCHYCGNGKCSNPNHLYWGTRKENAEDTKRHGNYKTPFERTVEKYGYEATIEMNRKNGYQAGNKAASKNKGVKKTDEHKKKISESITKIHQMKYNDVS